jgi:hypothetical protein
MTYGRQLGFAEASVRITLRLSGVASLERTTELTETVAPHVTSAVDEEGHDHSNCELCGDSYPTVQKLRRKISPVFPNHRVEFWVELKSSKLTDISQRLEYRAAEIVSEIHFPCESVAETKVNYKISNPFSFGYSNHQLLQRRDALQRLALLRPLPVFREFQLVQLIPLKNVSERSPRRTRLSRFRLLSLQ